jgi:hypothetical protein
VSHEWEIRVGNVLRKVLYLGDWLGWSLAQTTFSGLTGAQYSEVVE